jgi:integrase
MKLTETAVAKLKSSKADEIVFDDALPRFGVRLREGGSKKYVIDYRQAGVQRRYTIGSASNMTLEEARQRARKVLTAVDDGGDPAADKAEQRVASGLLFAKVAHEYLAACSSSLRAKTLAGYSDNLVRQWKPLHKLPLTAVIKPVIASRLREIAKESGPVAADRARGTLSSFFAWCVGEGLCEANPVIGVNSFGSKPRERVLSDSELAAIWKNCPDNDYGRVVKLLMLSGQRRDEIGGLRWSEVDFDKKLITLPSSRTKNGKAHEVPLSSEALAVLESATRHREDFVFGQGVAGFAGWSKCKLGLDADCGVKKWTLHDLRRTCATGMANIGVFPHVIEAVLNHVSGHKAGVAGVYNLSVYSTEKREALNRWANHVRVIVARAEGANVTKLKRKA